MITCPICKTQFCRNDAPDDHRRVTQNAGDLVALLLEAKFVLGQCAMGDLPDSTYICAHQIKLSEAVAKLQTIQT